MANQIKISAGKVPATVKELLVDEGCTVLQAMNIAAEKCGFQFKTEPYKSETNVIMMDVPYLNGKELCRREGRVIVEVFWDTPVSSGDIVLIVPKIRGNTARRS